MSIRPRLLWNAIIIIFCFAFSVLSILTYFFHWTWTGFNKSLWDWMQLLIVPIALAVIAIWFSRIESRNQLINTLDNQQASALQSYLDVMSELLLKENLRNSKENDEIRIIARIRTLAVLRQLDGYRKGQVIRFLYEAELIREGKRIINLEKADLKGAELDHLELEHINLSRTNLTEANLMHSNFQNANLSGAVLYRANLVTAGFGNANLRNAQLADANLVYTHFENTDLYHANLSNTSFQGTDFNGTKLDKAMFTDSSIKGILSPTQLEQIDLYHGPQPSLYERISEALKNRVFSDT